MRRLLPLLVITAVLGCEHRPPPPAAPSQPGPTVIFVGQPWGDATRIAREAGYEPQDASGLAMNSPLDGFYVNLPGRRGLLVARDPRANAVKSITRIDNWPGPKASRVHHDVRSVEVPPVDPPRAGDAP